MFSRLFNVNMDGVVREVNVMMLGKGLELSYNSYTSFSLRSSSCMTDLSIHFQPSRPATI